MFLLTKPGIKMLLLSILMFELGHKTRERFTDGKGNRTNILLNLLSFLIIVIIGVLYVFQLTYTRFKT